MTLAKCIPAFGVMGIILGVNIHLQGFVMRPRRWWNKQKRIEERSADSDLWLGPKGKKRTKRGHYGDMWMRGSAMRTGIAQHLQWQENLEEDFMTSMIERYDQDYEHVLQLRSRYDTPRPELAAENARKLRARQEFADHNKEILRGAEFKAWLARQDQLEAAAAV